MEREAGQRCVAGDLQTRQQAAAVFRRGAFLQFRAKEDGRQHLAHWL